MYALVIVITISFAAGYWYRRAIEVRRAKQAK